MFRRLLAGLLLVVAAAGGHAAGVVPGEAGPRYQRLGVQQGLSQATARALAQDGEGAVWIGTQDGLNRYDGYGFRVFRHDSQLADSLPDNHVTALAADTRGRLWVGTRSGGLGRYDRDRQRFRNYPVAAGRADAVAAMPVNAVAPAADGGLWVASGTGHLQRLDPQGSAFATIPLPSEVMVRALLPLPGGDLLVGGSDGLWRWSERDAVLRPWARSAMRGEVQALARARQGRLWVGSSRGGAFELDAGGRLLRRLDAGSGLAGDDVNALLADARGRIWIGTYDGVSRVDRDGATPRNWSGDASRSDSLASRQVQALLGDRDGLVWIGTWLGGVHLYLPGAEAFREFRAAPPDPRALPGEGVRAVASNPDGSLWLGVVEDGGLVRFDPGFGVVERFHSSMPGARRLPSDRVQALARAADGTLWVGFGDAGLGRLRPGAAAVEHLPARAGDRGAPRDDDIMSLALDRAGTLWVGYLDRGLDALCRDCREFRRYEYVPGDRHGLPGRAIGAVFEDAAGQLWVGARPGGLARLDRASGRFTPLAELVEGPHPGLPVAVAGMTQGRRGELWVGSQGGGLYRLAPTTGGRYRVTLYNHRQGLAADAIGSIVEDARGALWISTTLGISRLDPDSGRIENFSARSGAQMEGYFINAGASLADGRIAYGGLRGLTLFDPREVVPPAPVHRPVITDVRAFQSAGRGDPDWRYRNLDGRDQLWLPAGSGGFGFGFSALAYADPEQVQYSYRLDPIDQEWTEANASQRNAGYPHLAPGDYRLRLRARLPGEDYGPERQVDVRLDPLWWQAGWARAGFALLVAFPFAFWGWNRRQRGLERARAQAVLADSEERLQLALWGTGDEFWDADLATGAIVRVNPLPDVVLPQSQHGLTFAGLLQHVYEDDRAALSSSFERHMRGEDQDFDCAYRLRDTGGGWRWMRSRGRTVERDGRGRALRMAGVTEDITELQEHARMLERINQELESRVGQRTADLTLVNQELTSTIDELRSTQRQLVETEKLAAIGGLVAGIAHEVNTPLGVGVTAASHLEQQARDFLRALDAGEADPARIAEFGRTMAEASAMVLRNLQRADRMIRSFKQVAVDQASEEARLIDVAAYLDEILVSLQPLLKRSPHRLVVDVPAGLTVTTQPGALYQILVNLVTNSLSHAFTGERAGTMRASAHAEGEGWVLEYADDGIGMDEAVRRRLYDPFFTTRRGQGGSGLGMHIVYNLVQALGGSIECSSGPGQGTRFTLRMPRRQPAAQSG